VVDYSIVEIVEFGRQRGAVRSRNQLNGREGEIMKKLCFLAVLFMLSLGVISSVLAEDQELATNCPNCPGGNYYSTISGNTLHIIKKGLPEIGISFHPEKTVTERMVLCDQHYTPIPWISGPRFSTADIKEVTRMYLNDGPFCCNDPWEAATKPNGKPAYQEVLPTGTRPKVFIRWK
jgi:hypothetical protein